MFKLFDKTFFKQAFLFLAIVLIGFLVLLALGFYELNRNNEAPIPLENIAKTSHIDTPIDNAR